MKKLFFAALCTGMLMSFNSCKKCGYCKYPSGATDAAVCRNSTLNALGIDEYKEAETNCQAAGGTWIVN